MAETTLSAEPAKKKGFPVWILIFVALIVLNFYLVSLYKPIKPEISVSSESVLFDVVEGEIVERPWFTLPLVGDVYLTNALLSHVISLIFLLLFVFAVQIEMKDDPLVPHGVSALVEFVMSVLGGMAESSVKEEHRKYVFPLYYGIFFTVLITNLSKLLPIFETIGFAVPVREGGFLADKLGGLIAITDKAAGEGEIGYRLVSFLRCGPTDLNCALGVAMFGVIMIQVVGVQVKGIGYFNRFFNIRALMHNKTTGVVDFIVGILELVAEIAKIASFGFRLFGNMFAGMVLLAFIGFIIPWLASSVMMLYEVFIGVLQAFIFGMLTAVFTGMALNSEE